MGIVTALEFNTDRNKAHLYVDGVYALTVSIDLALESKLKTGMSVDDEYLELLKKAGSVQRCNDAAYRLLAYRARSEQEIRERLVKKGFSPETVEKSLEHLKERGLINDREFACQWAENRSKFKPQSAFLTRRELKEKGLSEEIIEEAVKDYDDYENALLAARARAMKSAGEEFPVFQRRLGSFLQRRGFGYAVIKPVISRLWEESKEFQNSRQSL